MMKLETIAAPLVNLALTEDLGSGDITTDSVVPEGAVGTGRIVARGEGVLAGCDVGRLAFTRVDSSLAFKAVLNDGASLKPGLEVCVVKGPARGILKAERVALNFLQRLSGVATMTRRFVEAVSGTGVAILDTRKTTPGLRVLEKYAVAVGGGSNHRFGLFDMYLVKDNHLRLAGGIREAIRRIKRNGLDLPVEVEVRTLEELEEACQAGADRVMLDNMSVEDVEKACEIVRTARSKTAGRKIEVEISGGVDLSNVRSYAVKGVDYISVGAITHSAPALDINLVLET
jgi:nicotinate-nucleotide pyrophosphorylase (carboxylating)